MMVPTQIVQNTELGVWRWIIKVPTTGSEPRRSKLCWRNECEHQAKSTQWSTLRLDERTDLHTAHLFLPHIFLNMIEQPDSDGLMASNLNDPNTPGTPLT